MPAQHIPPLFPEPTISTKKLTKGFNEKVRDKFEADEVK
jgi:hypothetical protein